MHALPGREFQIGLTMSGAISAGAYTAGVLDFLIEALDAWEDARNGPDADTVPNHRVGIKVMSGASAGAITAAISATTSKGAAGSREQLTPAEIDRLITAGRLARYVHRDAMISHALRVSELVKLS
jgi:predicted acylesterase/phospholipase RssA